MSTTNNETTALEQLAEDVKIERAARDAGREKMSFGEAAAILMKHIASKKLSDKALADVRLALRDQPDVWRTAGDLALQAKMRLIENTFNQPTATEAVLHGMGVMRKELSGGKADPLEELLIEQVLLCWLNLGTIQMSYANVMSQSVTLTAGAYWEKRLSTAQGRYLKAIEMLAKVRRLSKVTPLQVNIGGQQINLAKSNSTA